jgi:hypothetical protein
MSSHLAATSGADIYDSDVMVCNCIDVAPDALAD